MRRQDKSYPRTLVDRRVQTALRSKCGSPSTLTTAAGRPISQTDEVWEIPVFLLAVGVEHAAEVGAVDVDLSAEGLFSTLTARCAGGPRLERIPKLGVRLFVQRKGELSARCNIQ
jgi:hypothetical protein